MPHQRAAVGHLHDRAVVADERDRNRQQRRDRLREVEAASGDEDDLDAARDGGRKRVAVRVGERTAAVEQRAVDVDREKADAVVQLSSTVIGTAAASSSALLIRNLSPSGETSYEFRSLPGWSSDGRFLLYNWPRRWRRCTGGSGDRSPTARVGSRRQRRCWRATPCCKSCPSAAADVSAAYRAGRDVYATTAIFHAPFSRASVN
jgi:hypothetical protein